MRQSWQQSAVQFYYNGEKADISKTDSSKLTHTKAISMDNSHFGSKIMWFRFWAGLTVKIVKADAVIQLMELLLKTMSIMWQGTTHQGCWWGKLSFHEPLPTFKKNQTFWVWLVLLKTSESMKRVMNKKFSSRLNKSICFSLQGLISAPLAPGSPKWRAPEGRHCAPRQHSSLIVFSLKDSGWYIIL